MDKQYFIDLYNSLDRERVLNAQNYLLREIDGRGWFELAYLINNSDDWVVENRFHFEGGMYIRNLLRQGGFGEQYLGVENLDDYYGSIVEKAAEQLNLVNLSW